MQSMFYIAASIAALSSSGLHAFAGGAAMARPFYRQANASGINTHGFRYCWHFVTLVLTATSIGYAFLAVRPQFGFFGVYLTLTAFGISILSFAVSRIEGAAPLKSPPAILGAIIAILGCAALVAR
jgi:hypothetical protein